MKPRLKIRLAQPSDCSEILSIYEHYVLNTIITFEYEVPSLEEMQKRMQTIQLKYPYLVAEIDNKIVGYAYASDFRTKAAYQWSPESTIYLDKNFLGIGLGKALYFKLIELLIGQGFRNLFAGIALPNEASIALHKSIGFKSVGIYENIGYKHGKWISTEWFQVSLNDYSLEPKFPLKPTDVL